MAKDFLVSTADVAFMHNNMLAFTGKSSINTSISVSMEDQEVTGGKGAQTLYKYKYGRKLAFTIEMAEWKLAFIAANVGSTIVEGLKDVYMVAECVTLTNGVGTLSKTPVGTVFVETEDGTTSEVTPTGSTITVGSASGKVNATYKFNTTVKRVTIDAESSPLVGKLIMSADKHNSDVGKVAEIQIEVPSFQLNGTFDISMEATGVSTTSIGGDALAVAGDTCANGSVYAYITEIPSQSSSVAVASIAATPSVVTLAVAGTRAISIVGIKGGMYSNVSIDPADCTITSDTPATATVSGGVITGVAAGTTYVNITYGTLKDVIKVTVS